MKKLKRYVICVPLKARGWQIAGKVVLTLTVVLSFFNGIVPLAEHHGLLVKSKNGSYYYTHFPANGGGFIKDDKYDAIDDIITHCRHKSGKEWWVREKYETKGKLTIRKVKEVARNVRYDNYNLITKNCQDYTRRIIDGLSNKLDLVGYDALEFGGKMRLGKGGDLSI